VPGWDPGRGGLDETIGSDRLISLTRTDEGRRYFSLDGLRSVVNLTDDDGLTVANYHLDAWGNFRFPEELTHSANRFAFTGHIFDTETGLYNAKARYFDPKLGRFLTQDSYLGQIDEPPSLHRYAYGWNRPTFFIDPDGHEVKATGFDTTRITWDEHGQPYVGAVTAVETEVVEVKAYPDRASAVAAELDVKLAQPMERAAVRGMGAVRAAGGVGQVVMGTGAMAAPEPTMLSKVGGAVLIAHGADDVQAGLRQAITGEVVETLTGTGIRKTAEAAGASPEAAAWISAGGETALVMGAGFAAGPASAQPRTTLGRITSEADDAGTAPVKITIDKSRYPEAAQHADDAMAAGKPSRGRIDRGGADPRRGESLRCVECKPGLDRDEFPPAVLDTGGEGASVRHIPPGDNRGAGASMGQQMRKLPDGTLVEIVVKKE